MPLRCIKNDKAKQCTAKAKSTGLRCRNPIKKGTGLIKGTGLVCRLHGWRPANTIRSGTDHWNWQHGKRTLKTIAKVKEEMQILEMVKALIKKWDL